MDRQHGKGGTSLNYYDPAEKQWHQDWVGGDDTILHLQGGLKDGAMVMNGAIKGSKGTYLNRITWTPLPEGKVKQEWAISTDDGRELEDIFRRDLRKTLRTALAAFQIVHRLKPS